jgi:tetratricopeptide (TPR) repeat protein
VENLVCEAVMTEMTIDQALQLAIAHHEAGRWPQAEEIYRRVLEAEPNHPKALERLGLMAGQNGQFDLAIEFSQRALQIQPDSAVAYRTLGLCLWSKGRVEEAVQSFRRAIQITPDDAVLYMNLGNALRDLGRPDEVIAAFTRAAQLKPDGAEFHYNLGNAFYERELFAQAIPCYARSIEINPQWASGWNNLGASLREVGQLDEAMAAYDRALQIRPDMADIHCNIAVALGDRRQVDQAIKSLERAVQCDPNHAKSHFNLSHFLLLTGQFVRGWDEYEWRWKMQSHCHPRHFPQPEWDGSDLHGRQILLYCEQAFGDVLMFVRYAALVSQRGGRVILETRPELARLLQNSPGVGQVVPAGQSLPEFDVQIPLLSLPRIFRTEMNSIPAAVPYAIPHQADVRRWAKLLGEDRNRLRVGLVWSGQSTQKHNRNRSIPIAQLAPLAAVQNVDLYSLQFGDAGKQLPPPGLRLVDHTSKLTDFAETAALMANLDLIITIDTSVAHLAGAMGCQTWVLLPLVADFRWLMDRSDSPWYPTMRLFRQPSIGDWQSVMQNVVEQLQIRARPEHR